VVGIPKHLPSSAGFLLEKEIEIFTNLMERPQTPLVGIIGGSKVETKVKLIDRISEIADLILVGGLMEKEIEEKNIQFKNPQKIIKPIDHILTFDIGPKTVNLFKENIKKAKTVFWSGPLGKIEEEKYRVGSREIAQAIIHSGVFSVVGGGETMEFINMLGLSSRFNHISTGGGAMLTFLSGEKLPGIEALA
jgi:phosphoglycerate kinase